jgi:hypothetical protein
LEAVKVKVLLSRLFASAGWGSAGLGPGYVVPATELEKGSWVALAAFVVKMLGSCCVAVVALSGGMTPFRDHY